MEYIAYVKIVWGIILISAFFSFSMAITSQIAKYIDEKMARLKKRGYAIPSSGKTETGEHDGIRYEYGCFRGTKHDPSHFKIGVACRSPGGFKITEESGFDRFFKKKGICCEIQTGDEEFDDRFYLTTETIDFTTAVFKSADKRRAVAEIFETGFNQLPHEHGFNHLIHDGETMAAVWSPFRHDEDHGRQFIPEILPNLVRLSERMPDKATPLEIADPDWKRRRKRAFTMPGALFIACFFAFPFCLMECKPLDAWRPVFGSLIVSIPLLAVYMWMAIRWIRGRADSHRELSMVFAVSVFAFVIGGIAFGIFLNGMFDISKPASHTVRIIDKYEDKKGKKRATGHYVIVKSWRDRDSEEIRVKRREYPKITPGKSKITVSTKPGLFGYEWIEEYKIGK